MSERDPQAVGSNDRLGLSDDDVARLLPRMKHRPGMVGYECYSFLDVAQTVRAAVAAERERCAKVCEANAHTFARHVADIIRQGPNVPLSRARDQVAGA